MYMIYVYVCTVELNCDVQVLRLLFCVFYC